MPNQWEPPSLAWLRRWGSRGALAVLDQTAFSGSNFVMNLLLARWFGSQIYGVFSLAFAVYLLATGIHNALILEPLSVFGTGKYADRLKPYLLSQLAIHVTVCIVLTVAILFLNSGLWIARIIDGQLSTGILAMGICLPLMLLMWLARRVCYVLGRPGHAAAGSLLYAGVLMTGLIALRTSPSARIVPASFALVGLASAAGSFVAYSAARFDREGFRESALMWRDLLGEQWRFGRWIVMAAFMNLGAMQVQLVLVAGLLGTSAAGSFNAIRNFMLPMMQTITVISTLGLPTIALDEGRHAPQAMRRKAFSVSLSLFVLATAYLVLMVPLARPLESFVYAGQFDTYAWLIPYTAVIPLLASIEVAFSLVVRALRKPQFHLFSTGITGAVGIILAWPLINRWGVAGGVFALIGVGVASLIVAAYFYRLWFVPRMSRPVQAPA